MTKRIVSILLLSAAITAPANAALHVRGGGTMVYDDVLNVTWAADAGPVLADADAAQAYAAALVLGGFDDWRLPSIYDKGTNTICVGFGCALSELGAMHYTNFGSSGPGYTFGGPNAANIALFSNYLGANRWAYQEDFTEANRAGNPSFNCDTTVGAETCVWGFRNDGIQSYGGKAQDFKAWAIRDGDVDAPAVPEPATWAMLIAGFGLVGAASRRRRIAYSAQ